MRIPQRVRSAILAGSDTQRHWLRMAMNADTSAWFDSLPTAELDAVEVSGELRSDYPWRSYTRLQWPDFDLCNPGEHGQYDVVICEQVLEHVADPEAAARTLRSLLRPDGVALISVPFLIGVHGDEYGDITRWTGPGFRLLLERAGLKVERLEQWGNRTAVAAMTLGWVRYRRWMPMGNHPRFPLVVWAYCRPA